MISTKINFDNISNYLSILRTNVHIHNAANYFDINKEAENTYGTLLNMIYSYNLKNINFEEPNAAYIDLCDDTSKETYLLK